MEDSGGVVARSEALVQLLNDGGIHAWFANPGTTELPLLKSLGAVAGVRPVLCLHEAVATGAADGYGRILQRPAATLLHLGPGLANGLANLHNARKSGAPIVNVVGEMPTWHRDAVNSVLAFDTERLAGAVSGSVAVLASERAVDLAVAAVPYSGENNIATLLFPFDLQRTGGKFERKDAVRKSSLPPLDQVAADLERHRSAVYVGGIAATDKVLRVLNGLGLPILIANAFGRVDRGMGLPSVGRMPYWPAEQAQEFRKYGCILFVGTPVPQALFGFDNQSELVHRDCIVHSFVSSEAQLCTALEQLALRVRGRLTATAPATDTVTVRRVPVPSKGKLTPYTLCQAIAAVQPENAVIVDESITSGSPYWALSQGCPPFSHLGLSGGAIGYGTAAAVGAAIATPDRKVINIQADGSALYSLQALWTQARERLDVVTVICSNRSYNILKLEMARDGTSLGRGTRAAALLELTDPPIDWPKLAGSFGVRSTSTSDAEELTNLLREALRTSGPTLIEAVL